MKNSVTILMYHHILPKDGFIASSIDNFDKQMKFLNENNYKTLKALNEFNEKISAFAFGHSIHMACNNNVTKKNIIDFLTSNNIDLKKVEKIKDYQVIMLSEMHNVQSGHKTVMELKNVKIDTGISDSKFTERMMKRGL